MSLFALDENEPKTAAEVLARARERARAKAWGSRPPAPRPPTEQVTEQVATKSGEEIPHVSQVDIGNTRPFRMLPALERNNIEPPRPRFWREELRIRIIEESCAEFDVDPEEVIRQRKRNAPHVLARRKMCYRFRTELGYSLPRIATILNLQNHTSVLWAIRKYQRIHNV